MNTLALFIFCTRGIFRYDKSVSNYACGWRVKNCGPVQFRTAVLNSETQIAARQSRLLSCRPRRRGSSLRGGAKNWKIENNNKRRGVHNAYDIYVRIETPRRHRTTKNKTPKIVHTYDEGLFRAYIYIYNIRGVLHVRQQTIARPTLQRPPRCVWTPTASRKSRGLKTLVHLSPVTPNDLIDGRLRIKYYMRER